MTLPTPPPGWTLGVDTSAAQGRLGLPALRDAGVAFLIAKATEGITYVDPQWVNTWQAAQAAGMPLGAYHVLSPGRDPTVQAKHFLGEVKLTGCVLPPVCDFELAAGETARAAIESAATWVRVVREETGITPMVYCGPAFMLGLEKMAGSAGEESVAALACCPLWVAHYTGSPAKLPMVPRPWTNWTIWQASGGRQATLSYGTLPGTPIDVDVDYTRLTVEELVRLGAPDAAS